ncbi:hypothetical protein ACQ858_20965 [Variovorax ureilyticus]|uniref:hypothetical protein n=1 Tax=Variovorax ureilyticus TaxID=1836198 RepID=UPI003D668DEA
MRIIEDITFQCGGETDKSALSALRLHPELPAGSHCVYIYSLADSEITYPNEAGAVIYIGEACRVNEPSGVRFAGHISKSLTEGNNFTTNHTVTAYYYRKRRLRLQIYRLDTCASDSDRKAIEKRLIARHVKRFGAQPIGQGTTGPSYTPKAIVNLMPTPEEDAAIAVGLRSLAVG